MKYQDPKFNKEDYRANRAAGWRGQGEQPTLTRVLRPGVLTLLEKGRKVHKTIVPARMGIKAFKRQHATSLHGRYNLKHVSIRGKVLRNLKADSWEELIRRERKYY